jgi:hypothetical protein
VDHILHAFRLTSLGIALARLGFLQRRPGWRSAAGRSVFLPQRQPFAVHTPQIDNINASQSCTKVLYCALKSSPRAAKEADDNRPSLILQERVARTRQTEQFGSIFFWHSSSLCASGCSALPSPIIVARFLPLHIIDCHGPSHDRIKRSDQLSLSSMMLVSSVA